MIRPPIPRILCVDDERSVLDGLARSLRGKFDVTTAISGADGLALLESDQPFAVVMSDMRMPEMDGAAFLAAASKVRPDAVRVLLTGQTDLHSAIAAVNHGGIFRFLSKPCETEELANALGAAAEQNRLIRAERELLEQTLRGSVKAMLEILSLANPKAFARAERIRSFVAEVAGQLGIPNAWTVEIAASLAHVGAVTLPGDVTSKLDQGLPLTAAETEMVASLPQVADSLLSSIPRLETVREMILGQSAPWSPDTNVGAALLRIAADMDSLESHGSSRRSAVAALSTTVGLYDPDLLAKVVTIVEADASIAGRDPVACALRDLRVGMVIAADVLNISGVLLVGRGMTVTERILGRLSNMPGQLDGDITVFPSR